MKRSRFEPYQWKLFIFLSVATFFEGYDIMAVSQILPNLRADFGLSKSTGGAVISIIAFGALLSYFLIRYADKMGRRKALTLTIAGYTIFTFLTGLSPNVVFFAGFQLLARMFLLAEFGVSMVYAAEEFPAKDRGMVIGVIAACSSFGAIVCGGIVPLLLKTPWGWRMVYFVGVIPLVLIAMARRNLKETRRYAEQAKNKCTQNNSFFYLLRTPYRKRIFELGLIWAIGYVGSSTALYFWKDFAVTERDLTDEQVAICITIAALCTLPLIFFAGKLADAIGRKPAALVVLLCTSIGVALAYLPHSQVVMTVGLCLGIFGMNGSNAVMNAFTTELFPTQIRSEAYAWSNQLIGRSAYVLAPWIVGMVAERTGWGLAVSATAVFPLIGLVLIYTLLPETNRLDLEETAKL